MSNTENTPTGLETYHGKLIEVGFTSKEDLGTVESFLDTRMPIWQSTVDLSFEEIVDKLFLYSTIYADTHTEPGMYGPFVLIKSAHGGVRRHTMWRAALFLQVLHPEHGVVYYAFVCKGSAERWRTAVEVHELQPPETTQE